MTTGHSRRLAALFLLALAAPFVSSAATTCGSGSQSQSSSLTLESDKSITCIDYSANLYHYANSWYRAFGVVGPQFEVCGVEIAVELAQSGGGDGQPLTVNVYADETCTFPSNFPSLAGKLVGTATINLADQSMTSLSVPVTASIPAGAEMVVEVFVPDGRAAHDVFFPGSNSQAQTGPTYVYQPGCGDSAPIDLASYAPDSRLVMTVGGSFENRQPAAIAVDAAGNGILDTNEAASVAPSWTNQSGSAVALTATASNLTGTAGLNYTLVDATADYGTLAPDATAGCAETTADCFGIQVTGSATGHHDAEFDETTLPAAAPAFAPRHRILHVGGSFADVPSSDIFYPYIENLFHNGITGGCATPGWFCAGSTTLRQQMSVFLLKALLGVCYVPPAATGAFADVPTSNSFAPWIEDLAQRGITNGCAPGLFCPKDPVKRKQMATFLLKTLEGSFYLPPTPTGIFSDVPADSFRPWIEDLYTRGITGGCAGGPPPAPMSYCPEGFVTRGQMATFLVKTFGLSLYKP